MPTIVIVHTVRSAHLDILGFPMGFPRIHKPCKNTFEIPQNLLKFFSLSLHDNKTKLILDGMTFILSEINREHGVTLCSCH